MLLIYPKYTSIISLLNTQETRYVMTRLTDVIITYKMVPQVVNANLLCNSNPNSCPIDGRYMELGTL